MQWSSTPYVPDYLADAEKYVCRLTGASVEDARKIVRAIGIFAIAEYRAQQDAQPKPPTPPLNPTGTGVTMGEVKAYVDGRIAGESERITREVADAVIKALDNAQSAQKNMQKKAGLQV